MEFLELLESIRSEEASISRLYGKESGSRARRRSSPEYQKKFDSALQLIVDVAEGKRPAYHLKEAMTTSDFPELFGDAIDRMMLASYRETPSTFRNYCKISTVPDFRNVKRFTMDGAESPLPVVHMQDEYKEEELTAGKYEYQVAKYGRRVPFAWETMINDDLQALKDVPLRLGRAARRTEEKFATGLFVGASGPNQVFFSSGNNNVITGNPALSIEALETAMTVIASQTDAEGEPIFIETVELVVPPALEVRASNILNAVNLELTTSGGTSDSKLVAVNWMKSRVRLSVNYYIPKIATTANGNTCWFMFANPAVSRPAIEIGFLAGHESPEIWMKSPNAVRIGGGTVAEMEGDFDTDSIHYRIRHVIGGTLMDPKAAVASTGAGQ